MCLLSPFTSSFNFVILFVNFVIVSVHDDVADHPGVIHDDIHDNVLINVVNDAAFILNSATVILRPGDAPVIVDRNNGNRVGVKVEQPLNSIFQKLG